jgi:malic enzyme
MDYDKESVELHAQLHGKLGVRSKVSLASKHDLSLAYTPGVGRVCVEIAKAPARVFDLIAAAKTLASIVIEPVPERILPDPLDKSVGFRIGEVVAAAARKSGVCRN